MTTRNYLLSGWSLIVGSIISFVTLLYAALAFVGQSSSFAGRPDFVWVYVLSAVGVALILLGLPGWYGSRAQEVGMVGLLGMVCIFLTGLALGIFFDLLQGLVFPYLAARAPQLLAGEPPTGVFAVIIFGTVLNLLGAVLLALAVFRSHIQPLWTAWVWVVCAVMAVVGFVVGGPTADNVLTSLAGVASALLIFVALFGFGTDMVSRYGAGATDTKSPSHMASAI